MKVQELENPGTHTCIHNYCIEFYRRSIEGEDRVKMVVVVMKRVEGEKSGEKGTWR